MKSSRRWSIASHPSSGYMTQNSTPPSYSACSSSAEKIYRSDVESINSIEDLRKCSPLSSSFSSHQLQNAKKEIEGYGRFFLASFLSPDLDKNLLFWGKFICQINNRFNKNLYRDLSVTDDPS